MSSTSKKKSARSFSSADLYFFEELSSSIGQSQAKQWLRRCHGESSVNSSRSTSPIKQRTQLTCSKTVSVEMPQTRRSSDDSFNAGCGTVRSCEDSVQQGNARDGRKQNMDLALKFQLARRNSEKSEQAGLLYTDAAHLLDDR
eukprot:757389-Hanusia_phi.AAC.7